MIGFDRPVLLAAKLHPQSGVRRRRRRRIKEGRFDWYKARFSVNLIIVTLVYRGHFGTRLPEHDTR